MGKIRPEKEKKERKKKAVAATATARRFSFKTVADLRLLLAVALVVLAAMGIFAWAFRQIHIGYVEEDGWVVSSSEVYNSLNSGAEEGTKILLTSVKSNDEVIARAGSYYVGSDMTEYESAYPVWSNGGQSLYFLDDSASLVTEEFELLSTWGGMYVADGSSFNELHEQVDEETIYLVKLKNGLYQNALAIRFASSNYEQTMQIYSAASFSDSYVRWFSQSSGELSYHEISDPSDLTVYIGDASYSYADFLELLRGAGKTQTASDDEQMTGSITGPDAEEAEQETITGTDTGETVKTKNQKGDSGDKGTADKESSATADATEGTAEGASGAAAASSSSGGSTSGSGSGGGEAESSAEASGARSSAASTSGETADADWLAPNVQLVITRIGAYDVEFEVYITDESGVLRKATINANWTGTNGESNVRKSVREDGTYTISNLESGKTVTLTVTAKYRNSAGDYVEDVCATLTFTTLTIAAGTNTLYIDYTADQTTRTETVTNTETGEEEYPGYDKIYATQIEIQDLRVYEGSDGQMAEDASTMDYVRYFYVRVYARNGNTAGDTPVQSYLLSSSERTRVISEGIESWLSDSLSALYTSTDYRYEFELLDRYGESMKVGYGTVSDDGTVTKNTSRYASNGTTVLTYQDETCDRNAYTCAEDPSGKLTLGTSTYDSQTITVKFTNAASDSAASSNVGGATISELYLVENETAYGRFILWNQDGADITGEIGTAELTDSVQARYSLLSEATTEPYVNSKGETVTDDYEAYPGVKADGVTEKNVGTYDNGTEFTWTKMKIPAFAGSTYTIKLYASCDTGNREGTQYGQLLATRSNARTASLSTLGSVSFTRQNLDADDESATFSYTSSLPSTSLQPLLYKYEYDLTDEDDNTVFTLLISKDYEEISSSQQGIWLTAGSYSVEAADWTLNYSFPYTQTLGTTTSSHVVSGKISYADGVFTRTVYVDGEERSYTFTYPDDEDPIDTTDNNAILAQLMEILKELDTYSTVVDTDEEAEILSSTTGITDGTATVSLSFKKITDDNDATRVLFDADEDYSFSLTASELLAACTDVQADTDTAASEKTWGYTWLYALSAERAQLSLTVGNLASSSTYTASACAYAWQTGNYTYTDDESSDAEPALVAVTTTDASLTVMTTKAEPEVYMDVFATSSEITLYGFYVYDPDEAIIAKRSGLVPTVTVSVYLVDDAGNETLVAQETVTDIATTKEETESYAQDLSFGGLVSGATYYIKVTADALDLTADSSNTQYNYLIGEDETNSKYVSAGTWATTLGADAETGLFLERVEESDPYTLEGQLIDYTTADAQIAAGTEGGWEVGYLTTSGTLSASTSYRTTPYIDLRARDENGNVDTSYELSESDIFLGRNIYYIIALYDESYNYLGYARSLWSSSNNSTAYTTQIFRLSGGPLVSGSSFELSEVVYARVSISNTYANEAYFGRLDEDYFKTTKAADADTAKLGTDYTDVYGQVLNTGDQWSKYITVGTTETDADSYYDVNVPVSGGNIVMLTGKSGTSSIIRGVKFYDSSGVIDSTMGMTGALLVVPSGTTYMKLEYKSSDSSAVGLGLYILDDGGDIADAYTAQMGSMTATSGKSLSTSSGNNTTSSSSLIEVTDSYIEVEPGDLLMISNQAQIIALYDKGENFVSYTQGMSSGYNYLIVPKGVYKIRFANSIYSTSANWDIEDGYKILFLNCGSVKSVYTSKLTADASTVYKSSDQLYANLRIHISDPSGTESSNFAGYGDTKSQFWLRVYSAAYDSSATDDEVSDGTLEAGGYTDYALTDITLVNGLASVNLCHFVPVAKSMSYRVELWATKGSSLQNVQLGKAYFTVDSSGTPVFGLSSEAQISSLRSSTESFVLTQDVCFTDNTNLNGGTFYGTLDLQGNTLTTSKGGAYLLENIGSAAKRTTVIKNGTIAVDYERTEGTIARITYQCYGTIKNVLFSIDAANPVLSGSGSTAVYDNSMWTSEYNTYFITLNYGTIRNFAVEYVSDLVSCWYAGLIYSNSGTIENGYLYGDGCVRGGSYVGGLVTVNNAAGTVRGIYSTIDAKANTTTAGSNNLSSSSNIKTVTYLGTVIGVNNGTADGILATGNVYTYTTSRSGSNYLFSEEEVYTNYGCAVGRTGSKKATTNVYYATVGTDSRNNYSSSSYNERVEAGLLADSEWWLELWESVSAFGLDEDEIDSLLELGWYPWISMGVAADKYSILQPYLELDIASSASFDLVKAELDYMEYDDEGFETATVTFTFLNPSNYTVMAVTSSYLLIDVTDGTQEFDEQSGFCTVQATVTVNKSSGKYLDSYDIATVRYKRTATSNVQNSVRYTITGYTSSNGSRTLDVPFYYPLHDAEEWTTIFTSDRADENFRIWNSEEGLANGDPDGYDWNFNGYYTDSNDKVVYYQSAKTFTFSGSLDGTMFAQNAETGKWEEAYDENGALKTHVLTNMVDYTFHYNSSGAVDYAYWRGAVFPTLSGRITNLTVQNYTSGVLSSSHSNNSSITAKVSSLSPSSSSSTLTNIGFIGQLSSNSELENVHIIGAKYAPESSMMSTTNRIGGLVGYSVGYNNYTNCSVTDARISTANDNKSKLYVGGLVGVSSSYDSFTGCFTADLTLETCSSSVSTFDPQGIGGLVGYSTYGSYSGCYSSGTLDSELSYTGGLIGRTLSTTDVACCYSAMNITLNGANSGGLIGANGGTLTLQNCLYTGALSATSTSGTVHLMLGGNSSAATIEGCYAYQPNLDEDSSLLDSDGLELLTDDSKLTTSFYQTLFGSELYVYAWSVGSTDCSTDSGSEPQYLPGVAADGLLAPGQVLDETCYVPTVVADELGISDIWAFETGDRQTISAVTGSPVSASEGFTVSGMNVSYTPNDIEFTLSLGSYGYTVATIEIDGLAAGEIEWTNENKNYTDNTNFEPKGFTTGSKFYAYQVKNGTSTGDYRISLYGAEVVSYQDTYSITVTLTNGIVLKQSFQFRDANGNEEAKYLEISDAIAWNLYFGSEGELDDLLANSAYATTYDGYTALEENAATAAELLVLYDGYTYKGYAASSMNIKIAGTIDFSVLDALEEYLSLSGTAVSESPVMNVQANNVLGEGEASVTNLKETALTTTTYGLFKTISGSLTGVDFSNCTLWWASSVGPSNAGLVGTLSGGMTDCEFSNITLARGASYFGVVGNGSGVFKNITLSNVSVDTDGSYAGGLVGALHGDLVSVTGSDLDVTGSSYVGGLVGIIYSSEQEKSGHELIGGTDYSESAEGTTYTVGGWYETFMSDTGNYPASSSSEYWYRDSLSYDYALVDKISVADVAVTAKTGYVGGIAGQQTYTKSTNVGYGYLIAQHLTAKDVSVYGSGSYTGGLFGFTRTAMVYDVTATSVAVEGGTYGSGGLFGSVYGSTTYDYSACNSSGDRVQYFLSVLYGITCTDISVSGSEQYVGGIYGLGNSATILDAVEMNDVTVLAAATYVGGLYGYNATVSNAYMNEITAKGISVYNTGSSSTSKKYTGGLTGRYGYFRDLDVQDILVLAPGDSSYVGGITGIHPNLYTYATDKYATDDSNTMNTVKNVRVYGRSYVGGIAGSSTSSAIRYLYADGIYVTGTGDYVGGLLGYTTVGVSYVTASNITVVGGGAAVGGGAGKAISGNWSHCDFSNVTVTATGTKTATGATSAISTSTDADSIVSGEAVGGLIGAGYGNVVQYDAFTNVKVYDSVSGAQYVGGIFGVVRGGYLTSSSVSKTQVLAANADYVGGVAGYARGANNWGTNALDVTVSGDSNVGGMIGYMNNTSTTGGMGINKNQIKATVVATGDNVGGAIGGVSYLRYLYWNSVEATVTGSSTASDNVGGLVGYMSLASSRSMYDNQVVSVVNGSDYVSGMLGYVDGTLGTDARNNVVATNVTAAEGAKTSFFYYQTGDGTHQVDVSGSSSSYGYPYYLRLWEQSSITAGSSKTTATGQMFWKRTGTSKWEQTILTYWHNGRSGVAQLVTTADLENTSTTVGSNTYKHFDSSCYGLTRTTYDFTVTTTEGTTTVSVPNSGLVATSEYWSLLGFETSLTGGSKIYLPSPINPLRLSVDLTENLNESNYYTGNSKVTSTTNGYYFGSASLISASVETDPLVLSYSLTDGICVPGTSGSILSSDGSGSAATATAAPTLSIATAPQVYATGAYTLNVEFSSTDSYAGAWVGVYTDYGTDKQQLVYTFFANSSTLSYSMVYDFSTDITIVVADCGPLVSDTENLYVYNATVTDGYEKYTGTQSQQIVNEISLDADSLCSRVVLSGGYLYVIGSDRQVYRYKTTQDKETQDLLKEDENGFIHIYASSSDVLALTGAGKIVCISGSSTDTRVDSTVYVVAGAVADASFTTDSGGTGSVGGTMTASAEQAVDSASSTVNEAGGSWAVATVSGGDNAMTTESDASGGILLADAASESTIAGADTCTQHYLAGKDLLTGELSAQLRLYATADAGESSSGSTSDSSTEGTSSTDSSGSAAGTTSSGSSVDSASSTDSSTSADSSGSTSGEASSGSSADSTASTDSSGSTSGEASADGSESTSENSTSTTTSGNSVDSSAAETSDASTEEASAESALSGSVDSVDLSADDETESDFDESLLDAEPLFEFDYGSYHICTYVTYSLIFDEDGNVTQRNMQLFVKNGQLFALNAPDEVVPGCVIIDTYLTNTYMTVLRNDGVMVDLMDELNYPDDFTNRGIKNLSHNMYSDLSCVLVEYEDGSVISFNYLTGSVLYELEADAEESTYTSSFWSYISSFFRGKLDAAYADVSAAYANAKELKDYLSDLPWKNWFTANSSGEYVDGEAEGGETAAASLASESGETDAEADSDAEAGESDSAALTGEAASTATSGTDSDAGTGVDAALTGDGTSLTSVGTADSGTEATGDESTALTDEELSVASVSIEGDTEAAAGESAALTEEEALAASAGTGIDGEAGTVDSSVLAGEEAEETGVETDSVSGTAVGGSSALTGDESAVEETAADAAATSDEAPESIGTAGESENTADTAGTYALEDELIIAYDADTNGYALYAASNLLTGSSGAVMSVDSAYKDYIENGGETTAEGTALLSLEVTSQQQGGLIMLGLIGGAVGLMLVVLLVQRSTRRRRRSDRN